MPEPAPIRFGVVILAAGKSSRMGRPKMLLPWGATSTLGHCLERWSFLEATPAMDCHPGNELLSQSRKDFGGSQLAVVCDPGNQAVLGELNRLHFVRESRIMNPRVEAGMFGSAQCAARWVGWRAGLTHWIFSLGDQPLVREATLRRVVESARGRPELIWQPSRGGRARHPVILPARVFAELRDVKVATLKEFLEARAGIRALVEEDDPGLDCDLDTPEDYERLKVYPVSRG